MIDIVSHTNGTFVVVVVVVVVAIIMREVVADA
jgi:hypothetical protein